MEEQLHTFSPNEVVTFLGQQLKRNLDEATAEILINAPFNGFALLSYTNFNDVKEDFESLGVLSNNTFERDLLARIIVAIAPKFREPVKQLLKKEYPNVGAWLTAAHVLEPEDIRPEIAVLDLEIFCNLFQQLEDLQEMQFQTISARAIWSAIEMRRSNESTKDLTKKRAGEELPNVPVTKRACVGERAVDGFASQQLSCWDDDSKAKLLSQMQQICCINYDSSLKQQKAQFGAALQKAFPVLLNGQIFDFMLDNPLGSEELDRICNALLQTNHFSQTGPVLLYQVSGAGKTKYAYDMAGKGYTIILRLMASNLEPVSEVLSRAIEHYSKLVDVHERFNFTWCSLCIVYSWVLAHIEFLEYYQQKLLPALQLLLQSDQMKLTDVQEHQLFHLAQAKGSNAKDYIHFRFYSHVAAMANENSRNYVDSLRKSITSLYKQLNIKAIVFDELLTLTHVGVGCFLHNDDLEALGQGDSFETLEKLVYFQQLEMKQHHSSKDIQLLTFAKPDTCRKQTPSTNISC